MEQRFISPKEAAQFLGISRSSVDRLAKKGDMPSYLIGHRRLFDRDELVEWVKAHKNHTARAVTGNKSQNKKTRRKEYGKRGENREREK